VTADAEVFDNDYDNDSDYDQLYRDIAGGDPPPWEIGRPQTTFPAI